MWVDYRQSGLAFQIDSKGYAELLDTRVASVILLCLPTAVRVRINSKTGDYRSY